MDKKADDKIIKNNIQDEIDLKKDSLKSLYDLEDTFGELKKTTDNIADLLQKSIKGGNIERELDAIREDNSKTYKTVMVHIDEDREEIQKDIKKLYDKKDELTKREKENK